MNFERTKLPEEILRHNLEEKRKYFLDTCLEVEKSDAEIQVFDGVCLVVTQFPWVHVVLRNCI